MANFRFLPAEPLSNADLTTIVTAFIGVVPEEAKDIIVGFLPEFEAHFVEEPA